MGDEDHGEIQLVAQPHDLPQDLPLHHHVQGGGRFVHDHHLGLQQQRHGDHHALAHPAGEFVGVGTEPGPVYPHQLQHAGGEFSPFGLLHLGPVGGEHVLQLGPHRDHRVERVHGALEHHRELVPAEHAQLLLAECEQVEVAAGLVVEGDLTGHDPGGRFVQPVDGVGQGGLATTGFPGQPQDLAAGEFQADLLDGGDRAFHLVDHGEVLHAQDHGRRRRGQAGCGGVRGEGHGALLGEMVSRAAAVLRRATLRRLR